MKEIAILGVPVETIIHYFCDEFNLPHQVYLPGSTDKIREYLIECNKNYNSVKLVDQGELDLKSSKKEVLIDVLKNYKTNSFSEITLDVIREKKDFILKQKKNFDYVICIGPSHFGALFLYEKKDMVARFDFHGDYELSYKRNSFIPTHATYMNIVKEIGKIKVINYGWGGTHLDDENKSPGMSIFGEEGLIGDNKHKNANHFDVDVDCFERDLKIARFWKDFEKEKSECCPTFTPKQLEVMMSEAKPKKIGIWGYNWDYDNNGNGRKFIENVIFNCLTDQN